MKLHGANIVIGPPGSRTNGGWGAFWAAWDWYGCIKPQVDEAHALGANAIRLIGGLEGVTLGLLTRAEYASHTRQLNDYLLEKGMHYYAGFTSSQVVHTTIAAVAAEAVALVPELNRYTNIVGIDLLQEISTCHWPADQVLATMRALYEPVKPLTAIPLTASMVNNGSPFSAEMFGETATFEPLDPYLDYYDFHVYYPAAVADLDPLLRYTSKPVMIGEFGVSTNGGPDRAAIYRAMNAIAALPRVSGVFQWAVFDQDLDSNPANQWGMFHSASGVGETVTYGAGRVTDSSESWQPDQWAGATIIATTPTGEVARAEVRGNDAQTITLRAPWPERPADGDQYTAWRPREDVTAVFRDRL